MPKALTIKGLRLDLESAKAGKTWLLLPEGFRDQDAGSTYPLPRKYDEIQILAGIYIHDPEKRDSGCTYIRRAIEAYKTRAKGRQSAVLDVGSRLNQVRLAHQQYRRDINQTRKEMREALEGVRREAEAAVANLNDLFILGRKGIEGQMRAHLEDQAWQGEKIGARAFRECFRMVTQAVKGLGLPTEQRDAAAKAVVDELAASMEATKDALALAAPSPDSKSETEH